MTVTSSPALSAEPLTRAVVRPGGLWRDIRVVAETGSTNDDLLAGGGLPHGSVLVAESQTAGRGRQGRSWTSAPGAGLTFSMLVRPEGVTAGRWPWLPLLAGTALATAVTRICILGVRLKWPNDLLAVAGDAEPRKLAGILSERSGDAVAIGVGLNVSARASDLPSAATSLALEDARWVSRQELLVTVLREFEACYSAWERAGGDVDACGAREAYRHVSLTWGREVRVGLPGKRQLRGTAQGIDEAGRLVLDTESGEQAVTAGDVVHVR